MKILHLGTAFAFSALLLTLVLMPTEIRAEDMSLKSAVQSPVSSVEVTTTLKIAAMQGGHGPILDYHIGEYEIAHPGIDIVPQYVDGYDDLFALMDSDVADIDVFVIDIVWPGEALVRQRLIPLNSYIESSEVVELSDFITGTIEAVTVLDYVMAIPWFADAGLLYYRTDLLQNHGYAYPQTFDELKTQALAITAGDGLAAGFVWQGDQHEGLTCNFLEYLWSSGGDLFQAPCTVVLSSTHAISALNTMVDYISAGTSPPSVTAFREEDSRGVFQSGNAVFMRNWPYAWSLAQSEDSPVKDSVGVAPLPHMPGKDSAATLGGWNFGISSQSQHPEEAFSFIEYLTASEQQKHNALTASFLPTRLALYSDAQICSANPFICDLLEVFVNARPRPAISNYLNFSAILQEEIHSALVGTKASHQAIADAQSRLQDLVACTDSGTAVIPPSGGSLTFPSSGVEVMFPANALSAAAVATYYTTVYVPPAPVGSTFLLVDGSSFVLEVSDQVSGEPIDAFVQPVTVTIPYSGDPDGLQLRYWNGSSWSTEGIEIVLRDTKNNQLIATISHLSQFALFTQNPVYLPVIAKG